MHAEGAASHGYIDAVNLIGRLHRRLLEVIKDDFERHGEAGVNPVQALLLYHIGDGELTAAELKNHGHYQGANVAYNLKKLLAAGFLRQERKGQSALVSLTETGHAIRSRVAALYSRQMDAVEKLAVLDAGDLERINKGLARLERYWSDQIRYRL